jgi:hypothetical protein
MTPDEYSKAEEKCEIWYQGPSVEEITKCLNLMQ